MHITVCSESKKVHLVFGDAAEPKHGIMCPEFLENMHWGSIQAEFIHIYEDNIMLTVLSINDD